MESSFSTNPKASLWWARWVPAALFIAALIVLTILIGGTVLVPLLLSFALAFMLEPVADWFQRRGRSRNAAVLLTLLATIIAVLLVFGLLLPSINHQFGESFEKLPLALRAASARLQSLLGYAQARLSPTLYARLQGAITDFQNDPSAITSHISGWLAKGLFGLVSFGSAALGLLIVPFFVYYLLLDMDNLRRGIEERIPERHRATGVRLMNEIGEVVRGYVRGRFLIALIMAVIYAIGLLILGVPLWAAIGLVAGVMGIIPYIGVATGFLLAVAFALLDGAGILRLTGILSIFVLAQLLEDYVLTPRIIGHKLEVHPMLVFIALIVAGDLFGLLGLVLAIPVLGVLKVLLRFMDELYLRSDFYTAPALALPFREATKVSPAAAATLSDVQNDAASQVRVDMDEKLPNS